MSGSETLSTDNETRKRYRRLRALGKACREASDAPGGGQWACAPTDRDLAGVYPCEPGRLQPVAYADWRDLTITVLQPDTPHLEVLWRALDEGWSVVDQDGCTVLIDCRDCAGDGEYWKRTGERRTGSGYGDVEPTGEWVECDTCDGRGEVAPEEVGL